MNLKELINMQHEFQEPRGIKHTPATALARFADEVQEMVVEISAENYELALEELVDVFIMGGAIGLALMRETGGEVEDFDDMVMGKFLHNNRKYNPDFFNSYDTVTALRVARHWWNLGLHEDNWHENEDF